MPVALIFCLLEELGALDREELLEPDELDGLLGLLTEEGALLPELLNEEEPLPELLLGALVILVLPELLDEEEGAGLLKLRELLLCLLYEEGELLLGLL